MASKTSYGYAHHIVYVQRGKASSHQCSRCDRPAHDWAYLYGCPEERVEDGRRYSLDPEWYAPMCKSCHRKYDFEKDPTLRETYAESGRKAAPIARAALKRKLETDPEALRAAQEHARGMATPESRSAGGKALHEKIQADPELREEFRVRQQKNGLAVSQMRRTCSCGMESSPGAIGRHAKLKGHTLRAR